MVQRQDFRLGLRNHLLQLLELCYLHLIQHSHLIWIYSVVSLHLKPTICQHHRPPIACCVLGCLTVVKLMVLALILASSNLLILRHAVGHIVGVLLTYAFRKIVNHAEIALV
jgi:hypothetical protein